jgi:pyruvate dehydrogenase E1 component alpha subunit
VDGNDPDEVFGAISAATERARSGGGPSLVECVTFRFRGHSFGDTQVYMPKDRLAAAQERDPVPAYRQRLLADGICTEEELAAIEASAEAVVAEAVAEALAAPAPSAESLRDSVYADTRNMPA